MKSTQKIVVLTGAGVSAESGIRTFRDGNGLWEDHDVMDVASPEGWRRDSELVLKFYNARRAQLKEVSPNAAHHAIKKLEDKFEVHVITQNVDDLHQRAASTNVLHLHGQLTQVRSTGEPDLIYDWTAATSGADVVIIIGTSLQVYPAASLFSYAPPSAKIFYIDPHPAANAESHSRQHFETIAKLATVGVPELVEQLLVRATSS